MVETTDDDRRLDFEAFYRDEVIALAALATSLVGDPQRGADLAQEALLRVYRSWAKVADLDRPGAWARRVTINLAIDAGRRRRREDRALGRLASATKAASEHESDDRFWAEVRRLPERQRAAVALRYVDDLTVEEIAAVMEISEGTVKSSLFAARRTLAERLHAEEVRDGDD
jgi:RNA polymerase sigma-70 factor, ECF subfamily